MFSGALKKAKNCEFLYVHYYLFEKIKCFEIELNSIAFCNKCRGVTLYSGDTQHSPFRVITFYAFEGGVLWMVVMGLCLFSSYSA